ncbi:MAG: hypothetical protein Q4E73_02770 [Lachnospiraceae bacterium]|nr:hypothetical protein [Lachnospiraceae bacterium]
MNTSRVVDIKDMLLKISLKWQIILMWMLIFGSVFDGYAAAKSYRDSKAEQIAASQTVDLASYKRNLSTDKADSVEKAYDVYKQYQSSFQSSEDYCNNAIKMKIDYTRVPTVNILYKVTNCENLTELCTFINTSVFTDDWLEEVRSELGWKDVAISYISELITSSKIDEQDKQREKVFRVKVISTDKESSERLADLAQKEIADRMTEIQGKYPSAMIQYLDQNFEISVDSTLLSDQQWQMERMNNSYNILNNLANNFDDNQKSYYTALIDSEKNTNIVQSDETEKTEPQIDVINIKYILLGMAVGFFILFCYYACLYIFNKGLHSASEMEVDLGVSVIGTMNRSKLKNEKTNPSIFRIFREKEPRMTYEECLEVICMKVKMAVNKNKIRSLYITSTADSEEINQLKERLQQLMEDFDCKVTIGNSVVYDVDSLTDLSDSDGVLFLEEVNQSPYSEIAQEVEICRKNDIFVIGTVVVE